MLLLLVYPLLHKDTCFDFSFVHFVLTQNLPLPNRLRAGRRTNPEGPKVLRTPMEDPYGKSQERPKVFPAFAGRAKASAGRRKSSVVLQNVGGTKDLRKCFPVNYSSGILRDVRLLPDGSIEFSAGY